MLVLTDEAKKVLKEIMHSLKNAGSNVKHYRESLRRNLLYLHTYACWTEDGKVDIRLGKCKLGGDFAPWSFSLLMYKVVDGKDKFWFNGGMIFHGKHDGGGNGSAPTFSVCLEPTNGWSIHT